MPALGLVAALCIPRGEFGIAHRVFLAVARGGHPDHGRRRVDAFRGRCRGHQLPPGAASRDGYWLIAAAMSSVLVSRCWTGHSPARGTSGWLSTSDGRVSGRSGGLVNTRRIVRCDVTVGVHVRCAPTRFTRPGWLPGARPDRATPGHPRCARAPRTPVTVPSPQIRPRWVSAPPTDPRCQRGVVSSRRASVLVTIAHSERNQTCGVPGQKGTPGRATPAGQRGVPYPAAPAQPRPGGSV